MAEIKEQRLTDVCQAAVDRMGIDSQVIVAIEEMAELTDALCKSKRGRNTPADIITEIADVQIMMEQLSLYYGKDAVAAERSRKIDRLENRLQIMQKFG